MKISILGTNGFLSNAIAKYFYSNGWTVNMIGLEEPCHKYHSFTPINFLKVEIDYTIISDSDIIVYASGAGIQSNQNDSVDLIYQLNTILPTNISNKLNSIGYKGIFITFGSYFELGESNEDKAVSENEIITSTSKAPTDYVVSKRMLTRYISSVEHNYKHWHFILPTIYGPGENNKRLIPYTINAILNNEELHFTSGQQVRQYLYVGDVPKILNLSIERELSSGIYNIEGPEVYTVKDIVKRIHSYLKKEVSNSCFGQINRTDISMQYLALDGTKLNNNINNIPLVLIDDVLKLYTE